MGTLNTLHELGQGGTMTECYQHLPNSHRQDNPMNRPTTTMAARSIHCDSSLQDLPLHHFTLDLASKPPTKKNTKPLDPIVTGSVLASYFQASPQVPGVVIVEGDRLVGVIVRSTFFEMMLDVDGVPSSFLSQPLRSFARYLCTPLLSFSSETKILASAQRALRRISKSLGEPILVELPSSQYALLDCHTLNIAYWQLRGIETQIAYERMQVQMVRNDKMASLGRLVNGVSHEILDPVSFIWGNLSHLSNYVKDVMQVLDRYELELPNPSPTMVELRSELEIDYLREDIPRTIQSIKTGADRLTRLASSLQNFCHIDEVYPKATDIHDCLDSVLLLLKSHLKGEILVEKCYGALPTIPSFIGQITQVFLNILSYLVRQILARSVMERVLEELPLPYSEQYAHQDAPSRPLLRVVTEVCSIDATGVRWMSVRLGCNGDPISKEEQQQIIQDCIEGNPLTRESSLIMSYRIVTTQHKGIMKIRTANNPLDYLDPGIGIEFEILMPIG
jgi:signal transduction histidine kinase